MKYTLIEIGIKFSTLDIESVLINRIKTVLTVLRLGEEPVRIISISNFFQNPESDRH